MSADKCREEFEAWAALKFDCPVSVFVKARTQESEDEGFPYRIKNDHGDESDEANSLIGVAWTAWQDSRAALVVELPKVYGQPSLEAHVKYEYFNSAIDECRAAIESTGVKAK